MGKVKFTEDQQKVIDLRNCNVLVSAAAGSGKTAVLVERILEKISSREHPVDIDHLLIVTFTDAAAGEMRERISRAIEERLLLEPDNVHLERQVALVHNARITTIHSFCLGVIRDYFNEIDLDPGFRLGDETELLLLKGEAMEAVVEAFYAEKSPGYLSFVESYAAGKRDESIEKLVYRLYDFAMSYPWPKLWIEGQRKNFSVEKEEDFFEADWQKELVGFLKTEIRDCLEVNKTALELAGMSDGPYMYEAALLSDAEQLERLCKAEDYPSIGHFLERISWAKLSAKKDDCVDTEKREAVKLLRDSVKKAINGLKEKYYFQPMEEMIADIKKAAPAMNAFLDLTLAFMEAYQEKKEEKNLLDFNDMEHYALKILTKEPEKLENKATGGSLILPTQTAVELSHYYEEIWIDEYQDSNLVQETLLNSISQEKFGRPNVFMVGDVKQSIYKFRLARPELFMEKFNTYQEKGDYVRVDLKKNFRSRESVLEAINYIFFGIMKRDLGNIDYDAAAALYPGRPALEETEEEAGLWKDCEILIAQSSEEVTDKELEGKILARQMKKLHEEQNIPYKDMVVLLRSMKGWSEELVNVLKEEGIPARAATQTGYFSAVEVMTILNFLLIIDNPRQDIPLAAVLRSNIGGFSDEELAALRCIDKEGELYDCLSAAEGQKKVQDFLTLLNRLRKLVPIVGIYELLTIIYEETGYYNYVKALPGGKARCANLDMLLQKGADFEKTSYGGLFQFNRYIERLHQYEVDFGEAFVLGENQDTVSIMSIHKSKGLEFPVVFLAAMGKGFNKQDTRERILMHPDLGLGPDYIDSELRTKSPTLLKQVMKRKTDLENMGEELRVLYVAMTRAREKLILTGCVKDVEKAQLKWQQAEPLLFSQRAGAGNYLDLIMPRVFTWQEEPVDKLSYRVEYITEEELSFEAVAARISGEQRRAELLSLEQRELWSEEEQIEAERYISFQYPYTVEEKIKSKLTVSELKQQAMQRQEEEGQLLEELVEKEAYIPSFIQAREEKSGSLRGTVYHRVMENLSFLQAEKNGLETELAALVEAGRISREELSLISTKKLSWFLSSKLGQRMKKAEAEGKLYREQPFVIGLPASKLQPELKSEETVLVQGVIDSFFEEKGQLILMDYKTDRVASGDELIKRYKSQLEYYKAALEQLTGKKVAECYIYSFYLGETIAPHDKRMNE
ncbi:MAG: helicase-exonuclease AddAB subunit AddA [Acetivibrio ethanolgignens]